MKRKSKLLRSLEDSIYNWYKKHQGALAVLGLFGIMGLFVHGTKYVSQTSQNQRLNQAKVEFQEICNLFNCSPEEAEIHVRHAMDFYKSNRRTSSTDVKKNSIRLHKDKQQLQNQNEPIIKQ